MVNIFYQSKLDYNPEEIIIGFMRLDIPGMIEEVETLACDLNFTKAEVWQLAGMNAVTVWRLKKGSEAKAGTIEKLMTVRERLRSLKRADGLQEK